MKTRNLFRDVKSVTICGERGMLQEHKTLNYFRFRSCNIPAQNAQEAIDKLTACREKRAEALKV